MGGRRVVVTGAGLVSCLGSDVQKVWQRILAGDSGISCLKDKAYQNIPCRIAGVVPRSGQNDDSSDIVDIDSFVTPSQKKILSLSSIYALIAAENALKDAQWKPESEMDRLRTGVAVGVGMVDMEEIFHSGKTLYEKGYKKVSPFFIPKILINMAAGHISMKHSLCGPNHSVSTACATGLHSVGDAFRLIKYNSADVMLAGGVDAAVNPLAIAGFAKIRALSTNFNEEPHKSSRPFDRQRDGFVMSEGSALLVLEELEHAKQRNAPIYAEVLGYGLTGDANHITAPREDGYGSYHCMKMAIEEAGVDVSAINYINAHATSTPLGDAAEIRAIRRLFGDHCDKLKISSTKGATGHLLGGAGSIEALFTVLSLKTGDIPPTINLENPDEEFTGLDLVPIHSSKLTDDSQRWVALSNSLGFGGTIACVCFGSMPLSKS
ncbi:-oxoacyl-acyl-carrier- synthase, mitochondrial-like [Octopus vulgaris]|uniref:3-oxoacyl-[acyl-carrier-protein] synthase n=1 Tax=Octopus vulgaris TaxID=6645 RepID=A0AA36BYA5_OCTVU|nr:-oxoacyl-acyl-carrier- synthase, mitochondrial-like [Octopus vulgaris]